MLLASVWVGTPEFSSAAQVPCKPPMAFIWPCGALCICVAETSSLPICPAPFAGARCGSTGASVATQSDGPANAKGWRLPQFFDGHEGCCHLLLALSSSFLLSPHDSPHDSKHCHCYRVPAPILSCNCPGRIDPGAHARPRVFTVCETQPCDCLCYECCSRPDGAVPTPLLHLHTPTDASKQVCDTCPAACALPATHTCRTASPPPAGRRGSSPPPLPVVQQAEAGLCPPLCCTCTAPLMPTSKCATPAQLRPASHTHVPHRTASPPPAGRRGSSPPPLPVVQQARRGCAHPSPALAHPHRCQQASVRHLPSCLRPASHTHVPHRLAAAGGPPWLVAAAAAAVWCSRPDGAVPTPLLHLHTATDASKQVCDTCPAAPCQPHTRAAPHRLAAAGGLPRLVAAAAAGGAAGQAGLCPPLCCTCTPPPMPASKCADTCPAACALPATHTCRTASPPPAGRRGSSPPPLPVVQQARRGCAHPSAALAHRH